jgi:hypothetical protein
MHQNRPAHPPDVLQDVAVEFQGFAGEDQVRPRGARGIECRLTEPTCMSSQWASENATYRAERE